MDTEQEPFSISRTTRGACEVVTLTGELDMAHAPTVAETLDALADTERPLVVDLSELTFMDSSGLHAILTARARLGEADCRLVLLKGCRQVQRIFELTGVDSVLEFVSARQAHGLAAIRSS